MALRQALLVDQLDGSNLLSIEVQFRRLQTIEFSYAEKARCPALLEHVKAETEKEAVLAKSLRKAREEREAARKAGGGKKTGWRVRNRVRGGTGSYLHATPNDPGEVRNVQRDIFPLPFVVEDEGIRKTLSRGCQQRLQRKREEQREVNRCIGSLNQLFDYRYPGSVAQQRKGQMLPNLAQEKCLEFIEDCISEIGPCGEISGSEALDALRISCGYETLPTSSALGSFNPEKVSLPAGEVQPVELACAWGSNGQSVVEEFIHEQVLSKDEALSRHVW